MSALSPAEITAFARDIRRLVIEQARRARVGHIGSALCVADILAALYCRVLRIPTPDCPGRDRFVLSKGHAALALYASFHLRGWMSAAGLDRYMADGSLLGVHPHHAADGVEFSTGSLGYGLGFAAGCALGARMRQETWQTYVLISDAECAEGSLWESAAFAAEQQIASLTAVVDLNKQQALGPTPAGLRPPQLARRWQAFGWHVDEVDGHDPATLETALAPHAPPAATGQPRVVLANTVFGRGVSFMEGRLDWHYLPMDDAQYARAIREVSRP